MDFKLNYMKQLLLVIGVLIGVVGYGQTIDTTVHDCTAAKINNVYYKHGFTESVDTLSELGVVGSLQVYQGTSDSLVVVTYILISNDNRRILSNTYTLTSSQYTAWDGSANMLLRFVATFLNLTFK